MAPVKIENPEVAINGQKITFPVTMETGMFLELKSGQDCKLYSPAGKVTQEVVPNGNVPVLKSGENELTFSAYTADKVSTRMQVTVSAEGKPL